MNMEKRITVGKVEGEGTKKKGKAEDRIKMSRWVGKR